MKKAQLKSILATLLCGVMALSAASCAQQPAQSGADDGKTSTTESTPGKELPDPVELSIATFRVGTHSAAAAEARYFKEFQEYYNGVDRQKITLKVEEMPSDEEYYNQMKIRAASNTLPDVFEGKNGVLELAVKNGIAVDMNDFIKDDAEYQKELGEETLAFGRRWEDGGLYNISYGVQAVGYFYNKELFEKAGISPAKTWDEWMQNLQKLKAAGDCKAPLSLMTGENCWTTNLIVASMIGTSGETGNKWMNTKYANTYQTDEAVDAFTKIQTMLKEYALPDAVGSDYATAANHFYNEETAIIANGPWMIPDFTNLDKVDEGFADKVGVALYPEDGCTFDYERGYSIAKSSPEKEAAAYEFIKFKTNAYGQQIHLEEASVFPVNFSLQMPADYAEKNPMVVDFMKTVSNAKNKYLTLDTVSYTTAMDAMSTLYPQLADGTLTPKQFAEQLDEAAKKDAAYEK